jgi:hypothetical protein
VLYFFSLLFEQIRLIGSNLLKYGNCLSRLIWTSDGRCRCLSNIKSERILEKRKKKENNNTLSLSVLNVHLRLLMERKVFLILHLLLTDLRRIENKITLSDCHSKIETN